MIKKFVFLLGLISFVSSISLGNLQSGRYFDRVIFVIFENTDYQKAVKQPFLASLNAKGVHFTNFSAITHPSQGNYVALTSGSLNGVRDDRPIDLNVPNVVDLLEAKGVSWKVYAENFPGNCYIGSDNKGYARKHNPFISYLNIQKNPQRCANIVNANEFDLDARTNRLPDYVFYIPNEKNDGHDTGVTFADKWYEQTFSGYFANSSFMKGTLIVTTFDENGGRPGNQIYTNFWGPMVKPGLVVNDSVNHFSLLKMVEDNWNLGSLGKQDQSANPVSGVWQ